ncbi:amidohydrolase family protein [Microbacterium sp. Kw_RZR3]|uniref:amidohydrolase family protein n=1 Tax=Microbacterium sp. Kw_RZR3 TaxID=3032903 RepID=UPI0023DB888A|nr:amidohydrolase family protein [Microbacterium sp. Kw_RZR3]MDF2045300.1 amidohydrolase family protein [Microbacterium sp. Kw_RZR3]
MSSLVVANGVLFSGGSVLEGDAVGIRDGRIVATGPRRDVRDAIGPDADELDARGGLVTPGFVDSHIHLGGGSVDALRCDLAGAASLAEIDERVRTFAAGTTAAWIVGGGWDPTLFPTTGPTAAHLDALVPDRPALFLDADHHGAWVNSAALRAAGIDESTPDPFDGRIERSSNGAPSGALREGAMQLVAPPGPAVRHRRHRSSAPVDLSRRARRGHHRLAGGSPRHLRRVPRLLRRVPRPHGGR